MNRIFCSNCGNHIGPESNFCPYCGAAQHGTDAASYRAQAPTQTLHPIEPVDANDEHDSNLPDTIRRRHLSQAAIWTFFLNYLAVTGVLLVLLAIAVAFQPIMAGTIFVIYVVTTFFIATVVHNSFTFEINHKGFRKDYGVIQKRHVSIPFKQIQNVNINRSLLDRMFGIAKIDIETAGSNRIVPRDIIGGNKSHAEGYLPGVSLEDAMVIHDLLLQRAAEAQTSKAH